MSVNKPLSTDERTHQCFVYARHTSTIRVPRHLRQPMDPPRRWSPSSGQGRECRTPPTPSTTPLPEANLRVNDINKRLNHLQELHTNGRNFVLSWPANEGHLSQPSAIWLSVGDRGRHSQVEGKAGAPEIGGVSPGVCVPTNAVMARVGIPRVMLSMGGIVV